MSSSLITRNIKTDVKKGLRNSGTSFPMSTSSEETGLGRVTRTVLGKESCTDDEWNLYQKSQALYGVFYKKLQIGIDGQILETGSEKFAYCPQTSLRRIPIKNEIVKLQSNIAPDLAAQNNNIFQQKVYWVDIIPTWNHPHLNALPNLQKDTVEEDGLFVDQGDKVNPLQLCPGDVTLEGRHGESLRFGGTNYIGNPITTEETSGCPYAIFRVGQGTDTGGEGYVPVYEDINADSGSIYLTTKQVLPLKQAATKRSSWTDRQVIEASDYSGSQILVTSDRLWLNGRDDIELAAKNFIGMSAEQVNIDGEEQVSLDATKIYLGSNSQKEKEPVLKGVTTTKMLSALINQYTLLLDAIITAGKEGNGDPGVFIGTLQSTAKLLLPALKTYKNQLSSLHSKKVFTE